MKRLFSLILLFGCIFPSISLASDFNGFFVFDKIGDSIEIYNGKQRIQSFKSAPRPARIVKNPDNGNYILLCRGVKKTPGALTFLDPNFKPVSGLKELPGIVVQDFYLKESGLWLLLTVSTAKDNSSAGLTCYNLKTDQTSTFTLKGTPAAYRFNDDQTQLAVGTLGDAQNKVPAELALIDLAQKQVKSFPISANPGAIYQTASGKIVVACGGFRNNQRYPSGTLVEKTETAELAKLHWIDPATGETAVVQLGYLPLRIAQDQNDSEIFYAVCANVYGDPNEESRGLTLNSIINSNPDQPEATFFKIVSGKIEASLKLQNRPNLLIQTSSASVCLQAQQELSIVDLSEPTPKLLNYSRGQEIDQFLFNRDGSIGYLSNVNSNYLNIVDLKTGKEIQTVKISNSFYIGKVFLNLIKPSLPPVIQSDSVQTLETVSRSENHRMFFAKDFSRLYVLAGAPQVCVFDLQSNEVKSAIKFDGSQYGIHPTPDGKYIAVTTNTGWQLLDPSQKKPVFSLSFNHLLAENEWGPETGYYSPNGDLLVVPFKNYLYLIDPVKALSLGKTRTQATSPVIVWPE